VRPGDGLGVLLRIQLRELPVEACHLVRQSLRLGEQLLAAGDRLAQPADDVVVERGQVACLVQQHPRLVLQLAELVVGHLQRAHRGQAVLDQVGRVDHRHGFGAAEQHQAEHEQ